MSIRFVKPMALVGVLCAAQTAWAQRITVQQPVFEQFTVGTTVSVPDRGGVLLGSVKRAGDFSRSSGLFGLGGRSRSSFRDYSGVSAHVWIHDFEEMDRLLLEQASAAERSSSAPVLSGNAGRAWDSLMARSGNRSRANSFRRYEPSPEVTRPAGAVCGTYGRCTSGFPSARTDRKSVPRQAPRVVSRKAPSESRAEKFYRLGVRAAERGEEGLARLHFRMAVRHGSKGAADRLAALEAATSTSLAAQER